MSMLKNILLGGLSLLGLPRERAVILMYHSVGPENGYFWNVTLPAFEVQMAYLAAKKKKVLPLAELVRRLRAGEALGASVAITFDDGYRDNYVNAFPVLQQHGFAATIFVETDLIDKKDTRRGFQRMSEVELRELVASGLVAIEPHSKTHPKLGQLAAEEVREEIAGSKQVIEQLLGKRCTVFAYPYGSYSAATEQIVRECGFEAATTVGEGTVHTATDPYRLPRVSIDSSTTPAQFRGKLSRGIDVYERLKGILGI